jgi:hypothetical protein
MQEMVFSLSHAFFVENKQIGLSNNLKEKDLGK